MTEVEAKFLVQAFEPLRDRILSVGGQATAPRHLERNWRFDLPDRSLAERRAILRIRQDGAAWMTYKEPNATFEQRRELELGIGDGEVAMALLAALGYEMVATYEKYREVYAVGEFHVMLDELPFGLFVEIEGPDRDAVRAQCLQLGLNWDFRSQRTYLELFDDLKQRLGLTSSDATFEQFKQLPVVDSSQLGLRYSAE